MRAPLTRQRIRLAWAVALGVDALQIFLFPATVEGGFSLVTDGLDLFAMAALWILVGWHWALLPSLFAELVPGLDLAPTWSIALLIIQRSRSQELAVETAAPIKDVTPP